jgi:hypothetical protein
MPRLQVFIHLLLGAGLGRSKPPEPAGSLYLPPVARLPYPRPNSTLNCLTICESVSPAA